MDWKQYQEDVAAFFRRLGCTVDVEAKVAGVRADHNIDAWIRFKKFGLETTWVIECKYWNSPIPKEKVLVLKSIVEDVGADRGILISAAGFQSGAVRAAEKTNITLTDLDALKETAQEELIASVLNRLETKTVELANALDDFYTLEPTGPHSWKSRLLLGVNGRASALGRHTMMCLEERRSGLSMDLLLERLRLGHVYPRFGEDHHGTEDGYQPVRLPVDDRRPAATEQRHAA